MGAQIICHSCQPWIRTPGFMEWKRRHSGHIQRLRQMNSNVLNILGITRPQMIGHRPGERRHRFHRVEAVHSQIILPNTPPIDKLTCIAQAAGFIVKQMAIKREDHIGILELINGLQIAPPYPHRSLARPIAVYRLINVPLHFGKLRFQFAHLILKSRRRCGAGQDVQAFAAIRAIFFHLARQPALKGS